MKAVHHFYCNGVMYSCDTVLCWNCCNLCSRQNVSVSESHFKVLIIMLGAFLEYVRYGYLSERHG